MGRAKIQLDQAPLTLAAAEEVDMHFVGAKLCAAMPNFREIQRRRVMLDPADTKDGAATVGIAMQQGINNWGNFRTADQAEYGVHIALARRTRPEAELLAVVVTNNCRIQAGHSRGTGRCYSR